MAVINMRTSELIENTGSASGSGGAIGCISQLRGTFAAIEREAAKLGGGVWDDDAQKEFMDKFMTGAKNVMAFLGDLERLFSEIADAESWISNWDKEYAQKYNAMNPNN